MSVYQRSIRQGESTTIASRLASDSDDYRGVIVGNARESNDKATRRIKGEIACAECRRLKIKCDKTVPCSTCIKRGCSALCPNSTIPPGESSRFVLAATDHLRKKMTTLEARMHALEDALAIAQAASSDQLHPLLTSFHDDDNDNDEAEESASKAQKPSEEGEPAALSESLGALHIDERGAARFFGPSGGAESLLLTAKGLEQTASSETRRPQLEELDDSYLPEEIKICYQAFPFPPSRVVPGTVLPTIEGFLPSIDRAIEVCETFMEHLTWMFQIVTRRQVIKELIPAIYKQVDASYGPHELALLLIVLGIGTLVDLSQPPYSLEAQHYYKLSRAALALQPVLGEQSMITIKVLHLMSIYNGMSGKESNLEQSYALLDLASQVAMRIGFHLDPSLWGITGKEAYDRRVYFWNLMGGVLWQSLVTGRPPSVLTSYIDCRIPTAEDEELFQRDEYPLGFGIWGFRVSSECIIPIIKATLAVKPPPYETILELDHKVRDFVHTAKTGQASTSRTATSMATFVRSHYQDLLLMFLHRGFFAHAMSENSVDPLSSTYGHSVLVAYSSACTVLDDTKAQYQENPMLCPRIWRMWSLAFSAAVIIGTVAIRGVHLNLRPPALEQLESACVMFQGAAEISSRAARAFPVLQIMLQKAFKAREHYSQQRTLVVTQKQPDDELSIFGGQARLVSETLPTSSDSVRSSEQSGQRELRSADLVDQLPALDGLFNHSDALQFPDYFADNAQATFADLSGGWDGMFHEVPQPAASLPGGSNALCLLSDSGDAMLDDRWSFFMHNYSILTDSAQQRV